MFPWRQEVNQGAWWMPWLKEATKEGAWWMPWLKEATKDAGSCENLR